MTLLDRWFRRPAPFKEKNRAPRRTFGLEALEARLALDSGGGVLAEAVGQAQFPVDQKLANFSLTDVNPNSPSFNQNVGPMVYNGEVSVYYFAAAG